jgi:hypothetical protein
MSSLVAYSQETTEREQGRAGGGGAGGWAEGGSRKEEMQGGRPTTPSLSPLDDLALYTSVNVTLPALRAQSCGLRLSGRGRAKAQNAVTVVQYSLPRQQTYRGHRTQVP